MATITAEEVISSLQLEPLAYEGGFYRRLHLSPDMCDTAGLGEHGKSTPPLNSVIYYIEHYPAFSYDIQRFMR